MATGTADEADGVIVIEAISPVYLHRGNGQTECDPDTLGPFDFVQVTYASVIRVGPDNEDDREIAHYVEGFWLFDDGTEWTDVTVTGIR